MRKKMTLLIIILLAALALSGCVNENSAAYTAEQTIRKVKAKRGITAEIICTSTTVLNEKPYESIKYALYDVTNDIEFTATARVLGPNGSSPVYLPTHRTLHDDYFNSYIRKQNATLEPFADEHGLLLGLNSITVSSQEQLVYAAEMFAKMVALYDFDSFKMYTKFHDLDIYYCAEGADSETRQTLSYFYILPGKNRIYLDIQRDNLDNSNYYDINNNQYHLYPADDTAISLEAWVLERLEDKWRWINVDDAK